VLLYVNRGFESYPTLFFYIVIYLLGMYLLFVFLPLLGSMCAGFFGDFIGSKGAVYLTVLSLFITFFLRLFIFIEVGIVGSPLYLKTVPWITRGFFCVYWEFYFDRLTSCIIVVISSISVSVHVYGSAYMNTDPHLTRFISYLSLFTFFILVLVTSGNYLQLFVGWEGVGVCSYLLINFWFTRLQSNKAAIKAMVVNRVADIFFCLGLVLIFGSFGTLSFSGVFSIVPLLQGFSLCFFRFHFSRLSFISLLLFFGAGGKSAQLFFHTWLPDAIEGPTPVSALIHAATIVTAGVFLLVRSSPILEYAPFVLSLVTLFGALTAFVAATIGLFQNDIKRVIAYSTCSQLGYIVFACGLSNYTVAVFHLSNHAFFKALLFLCGGAVIHATSDEQDMRRLGGLLKALPFTYSMTIVGSLSLIGFPFLSGFYSKDLIIEVAYGSYTISSHFAHLLGCFAAFFTAFYSIRLLFLTFIAKPVCFRVVLERADESCSIIGSSLFVLSWGAVFVGYLSKDILALGGCSFWGYSIFVFPDNCPVFDSEFLPAVIKLIPVLCSVCGALLAFICYSFYSFWLFYFKFSVFGRYIYSFFNRKWLFDSIYCAFVNQSFFRWGFVGTYFVLDRGVFEAFGPKGFLVWVSQLGLITSYFQTGHLVHYASSILWSIIIITGFFLVYSLSQISSSFIEFLLLLVFIVF
jgi:proton-translocating NADH-quinone oxidoreductase chain L